jgi:hypothetical protein
MKCLFNYENIQCMSFLIQSFMYYYPLIDFSLVKVIFVQFHLKAIVENYF